MTQTQRSVPSITPSSPGSLRHTFTRVAPASVLIQLLSFGSSVVLAARLGAHAQTDAYYVALSVPAMTYLILLAAVRLGGIPTLTAAARSEAGGDFSSSSSAFISAAVTAATVLSVLLTAAMLVLVPAAAGASTHFSSLTREYMIELIPYAITGAMEGGLGAILAVKGRFVASTMILTFEPVLKSVLLLSFTRQLGAQALVLGNVLGNLLAAGVLWTLCRRQGVMVRPVRFASSGIVRSTLKLSVPLLISQSILQLNPVIDRVTAAHLGSGSVTVFELGFRLFSAPASLLIASVVAPLGATWAARRADEGWDAVTASFGRTVSVLVIAVPPLVVMGFILRHDLVSIAFGSHAYGPRAVDRTADVFGMLLLGMPAQLLIVPLSTLFIITGETILPMKIGMANFLINSVLDLGLRYPLGVSGIALSTAMTLSILCGVYMWQAHRRWGSLHLRRTLRPLGASLLSCGVIGTVAVLVQRMATHPGRLTALTLVAAVGVFGVVVHSVSMVLARAWPGHEHRSWTTQRATVTGAARSLMRNDAADQ